MQLLRQGADTNLCGNNDERNAKIASVDALVEVQQDGGFLGRLFFALKALFCVRLVLMQHYSR